MSLVISNKHKQEIAHYENLVSVAVSNHGNKVADLEKSLNRELASIAYAMFADGYSDVEIAQTLGKSGKGVGGKWVARGIAYKAGLDGEAVAQEIEKTGNAVTVSAIKKSALKHKGGALTKQLTALGVPSKDRASTSEGQGNKRTPDQIAKDHASRILNAVQRGDITKQQAWEILDSALTALDKVKVTKK